MRRSASLQGISAPTRPPAQPQPPTNPQPQPLRIAARRYSARQLPKPTLAQEPAELALLRAQNASLRAQNEQLRRELSALSGRATTGVMRTEEKISTYRDIIRNKFTSRAKASRITTECESAMPSSKEASLQHSRVLLDELYDNCLNNRMPTLNDLSQLVERFFKEYCDNYAKIKVLHACLENEKHRAQYQKLAELIELYKVPLLYQKSPQVLFRQISRSKQKPKQKSGEREQICLEVLSPQETVVKLEGLLQKLCRSSQMLRLLRSNECVLKFIAKIQNNKR